MHTYYFWIFLLGCILEVNLIYNGDVEIWFGMDEVYYIKECKYFKIILLHLVTFSQGSASFYFEHGTHMLSRKFFAKFLYDLAGVILIVQCK